MRKSYKIAAIYVVVLLLSLTYVAVTPTTNTQQDYTVNTRSQGGIFVVPIENYGYAPIIKHLIDNAKKSVHISMLLLSDYEPVKTLLDSLVDAKNRGVDVKVVYEGDISSNHYGADYLSSRGVAVKEDGSSKFLHTKLVVIDDEVVYLGSHNWSPNALGKNNEYGIVIFNQSIANVYERYFQSIWNDASSTPSAGHVYESVQGLSIETTYDGYTYNALRSLIDSARQRLYVAMYTMAYYSNPNSTEERVDTLVNGIVSKGDIASVILDDHDSENAYNYLKDEGVDVMYDSKSVTTHLKLVIADDSVYVGDANWDYEYLDNETHTVGIIIHNASVANFFAGYFLTIKKYGDAPYYIPDGFVDNWEIETQAGGDVNLTVYLANGGYINDTSFYIQTRSKLNTSIYQYPSWDRSSVYDWRTENLHIHVLNNESGNYIVAITFYSKYHHINYTMYITVNVQGEPVPEFSTYILPLMLMLVAVWKKRRK